MRQEIMKCNFMSVSMCKHVLYVGCYDPSLGHSVVLVVVL